MPVSPRPMLLTCALLCCGAVSGETLIPLNGQSQQQIQNDIAACQSQTAGSSATSSSGIGGERLRGAAVGAAAGAAAAEVRGQRHDEVYDRIDDDVKQQYRQNQARDAAAAGVVVGGSRQRRERRADRRNEQAAQSGSSQAYINCMSARGYSLSP